MNVCTRAYKKKHRKSKQLFVLLLFVSIIGMTERYANATISFTNYDSNVTINASQSKLYLKNPDKVTGWSEFSIVKKFGDNGASQWVEPYYDGVIISQEGSEIPTTNLIVSNSNAINYGIKNNSNALVALADNVLTDEDKELIRTNSNAFVYCCKNTSNALAYGIKNNSSAIVSLLNGDFTEDEKNLLIDTVRTTSNAFLYCCKNTSNALVYGIKNNSNAIMCFPLRICGCCDGCEPVTRNQEPFETPAYAKGFGEAPQGERMRGGWACSLSGTGAGAGEHLRMREASWSPDNKFLAVITETEDGQEIRVYAPDFAQLRGPGGVSGEADNKESDYGLRLVTHASAQEWAHISSVAWSDSGFYLAVAADDVRGAGDDMFVYTFDAATESLCPLPNIDMFLKNM